MDAVYMALGAEVQEVEMQRMVFEGLGLPVMQPSVVHEDNKVLEKANNYKVTENWRLCA